MKMLQFVKQMFAFLAITLLVSAAGFADEVKYDDSWSTQGYNLVQSESSSVNIIHSVNSFNFNSVMINGEEMSVINMPGVLLPNDEGAPNLPGQGRYIAMPAGATARLEIKSMRVETFQNIEVGPAPRIPFEDDDSPLFYEENMAIYGQNAFYPADPVKISEPSKIRGVDVVMLGITPFQYNPVTKELKVLRDIEVEVVFEGGSGEFGEEKYRSRFWDPIMANAIMNFESLPTVDYNWMHKGNNRAVLEGCEYLILTPDGADFVMWANEIADFRNKQGILTEVVTLTEAGGNSTYAIESYVNDAYNNWDIPPSAVLLLGDFGYNVSNNVIAPIYDNYCASDNIYADVDGDHLPEMAFARITANNADQLEVMVTKFIDYETDPPTNPDFYNNPITAIGWQTERWFQLCGEIVGGFWKNELGKSPVRINDIYSGSPGSTWSTATNTSTIVNYFGPNGLGYIPATPNTLGGWTGGNSTTINNTINNGSFIMLHRDHGYEGGWGEPSYSSSNINGLNNEDLIFVMSVNCLTGKYNWSGECFTEKFHRHTSGGHNSGALGLTAASETSYSFVNDTYVWGAIDNMWPNFMPLYGTTFPQSYAMPAFGNAAGKYFLQQSSWPYNTSNKRVTYHLFHHHGGAFSTLYWAEPMDLTVIHEDAIPLGTNTFTVTANIGSLISLYRNGEILATATGTGVAQVLPIPALPMMANVTLTVTKQNYFRYEALIPVEDVLTAGFEADVTSTCIASEVNYTDMSQGDPTSWLWTFEGGDPATSTEQNPQGIMYNTGGEFDVTLEVSNANSTNSFTMENYISVMDDVEVSATVYATSEDVCEGEEVTFNIEIDNGGATPAFQWKLNGIDVGDGTDVYVNDMLTNGDVVTCEATSSLECTLQNPVMSNEIAMTVNEILIPSLVIETETTEICEGGEVVFTALPFAGGDEPIYQWKLNGTNAGPNSPEYITSDLEEGDIVSCEMTSNANCISLNTVMSNDLSISILEELPAGVSILATVEEICEGDEVTFTATAENGGLEPMYQWKVNGENVGDNSATFMTTEMMDDDVVTCEMISSYECAIDNPAMSNPVGMSVNPYPTEMTTPDGPVYVDVYATPNSTYTTSEDPNALAYTWTITPEAAWEEVTEEMYSLSVTWAEGYTGEASINVFGTNDCGNGPVSADIDVQLENTFGISENELNVGVSVFPNPNNGTFTIKLSSENNENVKLTIRNIVGENVYNQEELTINGEFIKVIDLSAYAEGIYFLILENNNNVLTEKIVVQ